MSTLLLIAGPCVIEDEGLVMEVAAELKRQLQGLSLDFYFKSSFDKANRSSIDGFRGPGLTEGLKILARVKSKLGLKVLTDFHTPDQAEAVAEVVDFMQIPAFLCRQTDMIVAGATHALRKGIKLNVKKGQFLAPWDAKNIIEKVREVETKVGKKFARDGFWLVERGTSFGYNTLVVDMASFQTMSAYGAPVIYDATHSVQTPGGGPSGKTTGGKRQNIEVLARAAFAAGAQGLFMECHPRPETAKSDGPNAFYLDQAGAFVRQILEIKRLTESLPKLLPETRNSPSMGV